MKLDAVISDIGKEILTREKYISLLQVRKDKLAKIREQYPDAELVHNILCLPNIWDKITCMRIEPQYSYYHNSSITVKFLLGKKKYIDGLAVSTSPTNIPIASLSIVNMGGVRKQEITILDYKSIIPDVCPKKNAFIKRIKMYLLNKIVIEKLIISDKSFGKEEISKLMLLR